MFGSDYPALTPERWMADFDTLTIKPEVRPLIVKENAVRLLGLGAKAAKHAWRSAPSRMAVAEISRPGPPGVLAAGDSRRAEARARVKC